MRYDIYSAHGAHYRTCHNPIQLLQTVQEYAKTPYLFLLVETPSTLAGKPTAAYLLQDNRRAHYLAHTKNGVWSDTDSQWMFTSTLQENANLIARYIKDHELDPMAGNDLFVITVRMQGAQLPTLTITELNIEDYVGAESDDNKGD